MGGCAFIKPDGTRCKGRAMEGYEWCYNHRPDLAEERRRNASKGGKAGGRGRPTTEVSDVREIQGQIRAVIHGVLSGKVEKGAGGVCFMGYNTLLRAVQVELKVKETEEFEDRLEALEQAQKERGGRGRWQA